MSAPKFEARCVGFGTGEYRTCFALRERILRAPLGMVMTEEDLATEPACLHFGAFIDEKTVGAGVLEIWADGIYYLKQLAVENGLQGQGIGTQLMEAMERAAQRQGGKALALHARQTARHFYEKLGYTASGDIFHFASLPHIHMQKPL